MSYLTPAENALLARQEAIGNLMHCLDEIARAVGPENFSVSDDRDYEALEKQIPLP